MALFLIVGLADCPYFAQLEHDFHYVASRIPEMIITKRSFLDNSDFQNFKASHKNISSHPDFSRAENKLPIVLREYSNINGASRIIGGFSEAREYLSQYYGYNRKMDTSEMVGIAKENFDIQKELSQKNADFSEKLDSNLVSICIFDTACTAESPISIAYYFVPLLIQHLETRTDIDQENFMLDINIIYSYSDSKAVALKMELEDCAYKSLASINLYKADLESFTFPKSLQTKIFATKFVFLFENYKICEKLLFHKDSRIFVHLVQAGEIEANLFLNELNFQDADENLGNSGKKHENTISTLAFTYENVIKSILATKLSGTHAGENDLKIRSVQMTNIKVYGKVGLRNKWQVDMSSCCIQNLENSAITFEGAGGLESPPQNSQMFCRALKDIIVDKKFITGELQKLADDRILCTPTSKRLVSESKAALSGFAIFESRQSSHFISTFSNGMALPHEFPETGIFPDKIGLVSNNSTINSLNQSNCLGLDGISNENVKNDVINFNNSSADEEVTTTTEGEAGPVGSSVSSALNIGKKEVEPTGVDEVEAKNPSLANIVEE